MISADLRRPIHPAPVVVLPLPSWPARSPFAGGRFLSGLEMALPSVRAWGPTARWSPVLDAWASSDGPFSGARPLLLPSPEGSGWYPSGVCGSDWSSALPSERPWAGGSDSPWLGRGWGITRAGPSGWGGPRAALGWVAARAAPDGPGTSESDGRALARTRGTRGWAVSASSPPHAKTSLPPRCDGTPSGVAGVPRSASPEGPSAWPAARPGFSVGAMGLPV